MAASFTALDAAGADPAASFGWRVVLGYFALTLLLTYPLSMNPAGSVLSQDPDTDLFIWTLAWDTHALTHQPLSMFDANIYYPQRRTLAYSENMIGNLLFAAPVLWLTANPVLAMNVVALASCVLCGLGGYLLARRVGVGPAGAALSGLVFAFSPPRFLRLGQIHLTSVQWMPFALAFLHTYLDGGGKNDARLAALFFTLQVLSSGHGAVFVTIAMLGLVLYRIGLGEPLAIAKRARDLGAPGALLLAPAVLVGMPYLAVQTEMGLRRSLEDWAVPASTFLASPTYAHAFILSVASETRINQDAVAWLFPGYLPLLLAAVALLRRDPSAVPAPPDRHGTAWTRAAIVLELAGLATLIVGLVALARGPFRLRLGDTVVASVRQPLRAWMLFVFIVAVRSSIARRAPLGFLPRVRRCREAYRRWSAARRHDMRTFYALLTLVGVWLSVGPPLGLWPAVYWLPGLNFIRVPSRFTLMAMLGLAVLTGIGFDRLTARLEAKKSLAWAVLVGTLLVAEFAVVPWDTTRYRVDTPAIDRWLDSLPKPFAIAEVPLPPFGAGGAWERRQTEYMLHSMAHWQKTVHGYSGFRPPLHQELYGQLRTFPDLRSLDTLRRLDVTYIVVHTDLYAPGDWPIVEGRIEQFEDRLRLVHVEGAGRVYSLRSAAPLQISASSSRRAR
jgi:hypothetical protein